MDYDVIIIGSGVAGLTASAYLTKAGHSILLCEKENSCGGLVQSFDHNGFIFDAGIRALENAGALFPMLKQLGLEMELVKSHITLGIEDKVIAIRSNESVEQYKNLLIELYPESKTEIELIILKIHKIMGYMDVQYGIDNPLFLDIKADREYFLKEVFPWMFKYALTAGKIAAINKPVVNYLNEFTKNQSLLDIITQHFFTETPAYFALSYIKLYLDYYYPKGGTGKLSEKLLHFIKQHGGEVRTKTEIISVNPEKRTVTDSAHNIYGYKNLLWAADLKRLYQCIDSSTLSDIHIKSTIDKKKELLSNKTGNDSVFTLYVSLDLDKEYFASIASEHFFYTPSRKGLSNAGKVPINESWKSIQDWLENFFYLTTYEISIPALRDPALSPPGKTGLIVSVLFDYRLTKYINDKGWYQEFKELSESLMINTLEKSIYPGITAAIIDKFSSTPVSLEQITGNTDGAITGWAFTNHPMPAENRLPMIGSTANTPIPGIFQAGQWTFSPSGFPVSLITAKVAADKILKTLRKKK